MVAMIAAIGATSFALADDVFNKAAAQQLTPSACEERGKLVINVEQKVLNDADSGEQGNYWAYDNYKRHIQVWETNASGVYCAIVSYRGNFTTVAGAAPGPSGTVGAGIKGEMDGGRRATIVGTLKTEPDWRTRGAVGTFNYDCNITTGVCPGLVSWVSQYFNAGASYADIWWGWSYKAGRHGTWINSVDGNSGNIQ